MDQPEKGYSVDPITRDDLDKALEKVSVDIKGHIDLIIAPITKEQTEVRIILTGPSRMNGLVGKMKAVTSNLKVIYALLVFLAIAIFKRMFMDT